MERATIKDRKVYLDPKGNERLLPEDATLMDAVRIEGRDGKKFTTVSFETVEIYLVNYIDKKTMEKKVRYVPVEDVGEYRKYNPITQKVETTLAYQDAKGNYYTLPDNAIKVHAIRRQNKEGRSVISVNFDLIKVYEVSFVDKKTNETRKVYIDANNVSERKVAIRADGRYMVLES